MDDRWWWFCWRSKTRRGRRAADDSDDMLNKVENMETWWAHISFYEYKDKGSTVPRTFSSTYTATTTAHEDMSRLPLFSRKRSAIPLMEFSDVPFVLGAVRTGSFYWIMRKYKWITLLSMSNVLKNGIFLENGLNIGTFWTLNSVSKDRRLWSRGGWFWFQSQQFRPLVNLFYRAFWLINIFKIQMVVRVTSHSQPKKCKNIEQFWYPLSLD